VVGSEQQQQNDDQYRFSVYTGAAFHHPPGQVCFMRFPNCSRHSTGDWWRAHATTPSRWRQPYEQRSTRCFLWQTQGHVVHVPKYLCAHTTADCPRLWNTITVGQFFVGLLWQPVTLRSIHKLATGSEPPPLPLESYIFWALNELPLPPPGSTLKVYCKIANTFSVKHIFLNCR
jgi:hypothetical protein